MNDSFSYNRQKAIDARQAEARSLWKQGIEISPDGKTVSVDVAQAFCMCHTGYIRYRAGAQPVFIIPEHNAGGMTWEDREASPEQRAKATELLEKARVCGFIPSSRQPWGGKPQPFPNWL